MTTSRQADPFTVLGLPATRGLTDDEVRTAWRRIASDTHPDRADGGDPARFAAAAAAYTALRTEYGRAETLADLARSGRGRRGGRPGLCTGRRGAARHACAYHRRTHLVRAHRPPRSGPAWLTSAPGRGAPSRPGEAAGAASVRGLGARRDQAERGAESHAHLVLHRG